MTAFSPTSLAVLMLVLLSYSWVRPSFAGAAEEPNTLNNVPKIPDSRLGSSFLVELALVELALVELAPVRLLALGAALPEASVLPAILSNEAYLGNISCRSNGDVLLADKTRTAKTNTTKTAAAVKRFFVWYFMDSILYPNILSFRGYPRI